MNWPRLYAKTAHRAALMTLIVVCAGCWEKIEYKGPRTTSSSHPPTRIQAPVAEPNAPPVVEPAPAPVASTPTPPTSPTPTASVSGDDLFAPVAESPQTVGDRYSTLPAANAPPPTANEPPPVPSVAPVAPSAVEPNQPLPSAQVEPAPRHTDAAAASVEVAEPANVALSSRRAAWMLGSSMSLAALAHDRGVAAQKVPLWFDEARMAGTSLGVTLPDLPEAGTAEDVPASKQVINYLGVNGQQIGRELSKQRGPDHSALFEIALKSNILVVLYTPGSSAGDSIATAIMQAAPQAKLPPEFWQPLVVALRKKSPQAEVQAAVRKMHIDVDQYLFQEGEHAAP